MQAVMESVFSVTYLIVVIALGTMILRGANVIRHTKYNYFLSQQLSSTPLYNK